MYIWLYFATTKKSHPNPKYLCLTAKIDRINKVIELKIIIHKSTIVVVDYSTPVSN